MSHDFILTGYTVKQLPAGSHIMVLDLDADICFCPSDVPVVFKSFGDVVREWERLSPRRVLPAEEVRAFVSPPVAPAELA